MAKTKGAANFRTLYFTLALGKCHSPLSQPQFFTFKFQKGNL